MVATDPLWLPSLSYDETELRKMDSAVVMANGTAVGSRAGIRPGDPGLAVSLAGTTVNVTAGTAVVHRAGQGVYRAQLAATSPGTLTAANATFARVDLVYLRVWDTAVDSSGLRKADTVYLAGTPSASPATPSPGGTEIYIPLATINVPNTGGGGTGSATVSSTIRQVTVAPGGILPVTSATDIAIAGVYTGQARYNTVRGVPEYWNGSAWKAQGDYTAYTPSWTAASANPTLGNGTLVARWTRVGSQIQTSGNLTLGSTSSGGTGVWSISLPVAAGATGVTCFGSCDYTVTFTNDYIGLVQVESAATGMLFIVKTTSSSGSAGQVSSTVPVASSSSSRLYWSVTYESA
ncbi:hypothetical protein [Streptomyces virginiae]|uniref:hypothetical protein n=1 Tax=Streptomyces virginiae TaxID=1961 RepID=UPI00224E061A|nr:hypothetical protein [Streptomyces virginiae]MCX5176706.1 hypothetical protein [Streptomyces virginiae]